MKKEHGSQLLALICYLLLWDAMIMGNYQEEPIGITVLAWVIFIYGLRKMHWWIITVVIFRREDKRLKDISP